MSVTENNGVFEHLGIVQKADSKSVIVKILSESACAGCHAENMCSLTGKEEKLVEVRGSYNVSPGETVTIMMKKTIGFRAVILSYVIPLVVIVTALVIMLDITSSELLAGLISISVLIPYYFIIWLFRNQINDKFTFSLKN